MDNKEESIFQLVSQLCEKFVKDRSKISKSRSKCYEILLGKTYPAQIKAHKDLTGSLDPVCNLIAWEYQLLNDYDLKEHSIELQETAEVVEYCYGDKKDDFRNVLQFLLSLRNVPADDDKILDLSTLPNITQQKNYASIFNLPKSLTDEWEGNEQINCLKENANLNPYNFDKRLESNTNLTCKTKLSDYFKDEGYFSPTKGEDDDIWHLASTLEYSNRRTWEEYGHPEPEKELPFLSELGDLQSLWVENLPSLYFIEMFKDGNVIKSNIKSRRAFIKDVKYLLVGMVSDSFGYNNNGEFYLTPSITIDGITPASLKQYCTDLLFCGTCFKALEKLSTPNAQTGNYEYQGYIFSELCKSISRYLQFYRTATLSIPDSTPCLSLHGKTYPLRLQILTLTSICQIGPYTRAEHIPHGVALLSYLYQKVSTLTDKNVLMVLYSILYPCCQVYFSRFLKQWILEGVINDPYGEFFIKPNYKYISMRGRIYWTRSYFVREDIVPEFLMDLKNDILCCGKVMNLLKLCVPECKLCLYLMGKKPPIVSCCLTAEQLSELKQSTTNYYLEVCSEVGLKFDISEFLLKNKELDPVLFNLISKKRSITLQRIELERKKAVQEYKEKRNEELLMLKEQYDSAVELKQIRMAAEIEREIKVSQENFALEAMRQELVEQEAGKLIAYYSELCAQSDERKNKIEKNLVAIKNMNNAHSNNNLTEVHSCVSEDDIKVDNFVSNISLKSGSSDSTYYSVDDKKEKTEDINKDEETNKENDLDLLNANKDIQVIHSVQNGNVDMSIQTDKTKYDENTRQAIINFETARKIKQKVMSQEMGIEIVDTMQIKKPVMPCQNLTEFQRNKMKVLNSEFGIQVSTDDVNTKTSTPVQINRDKMMHNTGIEEKPFFDVIEGPKPTLTSLQINRNKNMNSTPIKEIEKPSPTLTNLQINRNKMMNNVTIEESSPLDNISKTKTSLTSLQINRNKMMSTGPNFYGLMYQNDNDNFINRNLNSNTATIKKSKSLILELNRQKSDTPEKPTPMSVDSTPQSDFPLSGVTTPTSTFIGSLPTTADTHMTDAGFDFTGKRIHVRNSTMSLLPTKNFSKRVTPQEAKGISTNCLKLFLNESIMVPLITQTKLVNNELLRFFVETLNYMDHLNNLRNYFFLQDGEFGRNITENLFEKLYDATVPIQLINGRTLHYLMFGALDNSCKSQENAGKLSFKINCLPKCFDLGDPDVLDCLSLTYTVAWPMNILLPVDTIGKYDEVFRFLVKLNRIHWVLKKIFLELKVLAKETGNKEIYLMASPQYRKLHQSRHIMTHFVQTFQNYIVGEVLQSNWAIFEKRLLEAKNLDDLYNLHTAYIKNILSMCFLNQKMLVLKTVVHKIFVVILKFYDYLRSRSWKCVDGTYVHPNFDKLESIFNNFEEFIRYFLKVCKKVGKCGYQPHLLQLLDMLDINGFYSNC
ncbi:unnamed protein product [Brassicogethes aeneus]|uniref:Gamma-tubulin complex component 6 n=1 Tax=Brassicogethes aeneus TaxID=1431903 RepID=A0A9P0FNH1_BRAAE|nr:unnamed protein product [Brassicogethes aeneus]